MQETDRISVCDLAELAPDRPVEIVLHHGDGSQDRVQTRQSLNAEQIEWFRAGSALNVLRTQKA